MDVSKIDKNMKQAQTTSDGLRLYPQPCEPFALYGLSYSEQEDGFYRFSRALAEQLPLEARELRVHTAGGRIRFKTDSRRLHVKASYPGLGLMGHMALSGSGGFSLLERTTDGNWAHVATIRPEPWENEGFERTVALPENAYFTAKKDGELRDYILFFPLYNLVSALTLGLDEGAAVERGSEYLPVPPILYYGSSITQGGCASRPDAAYQAIISKRNDIDFINVGMSGNAKGEPVMADFLASLDCSAFVCDYDHNAPSVEHLKSTHYPLYERFRATKPTVPIIFVTKPDIEHNADHAARRAVVLETYERVKANGDDNVYFIDGGKIFPDSERGACTVDGCHPTDLGFYFMANEIGKTLETALKINERG